MRKQPGWVVGSDPLQLLPLIMVFLTPFAVVTIAQVAGVRQATIDSVGHGVPARPEGFITIVVSYGIPARAVAIGLVFASLNTIITLTTDALLRSGDLAAVSAAPWVKPMCFHCCSDYCPKLFRTGVD